MIDFSKKRYFIFDLDGTLFDTLPDLAFAVNAMLDHYGYSSLSLEKIRSSVGNGSKNLVRRCLPHLEIPLEEAHGIFFKFYKDHCIEKTIPYPGVIKLLTRNFRASLLTNKPILLTQMILSHFGVRNCFEYVLGGDTTIERKPSPKGIEFILSSAGIKKEEAVMIGDDTPDLFAARGAGIESIMILNGFGKRENILPHFPENTVEDFGDLLNLIP